MKCLFWKREPRDMSDGKKLITYKTRWSWCDDPSTKRWVEVTIWRDAHRNQSVALVETHSGVVEAVRFPRGTALNNVKAMCECARFYGYRPHQVTSYLRRLSGVCKPTDHGICKCMEDVSGLKL